MKQSPLETSPGLRMWLDKVGADRVLRGAFSLQPDRAWFVVDENRHVIEWSPGAEALLGWGADDAVGEHCLKTARCEQCLRGCGIAERGEVHDATLTMIKKDGSELLVRKSARAFFDDEGEFAGGIEVLVPAEASAAAPKPRLPVLATEPETFHGMVTADAEMERAFELVKNVAASDVTVLVRGESGTGKELVARAIHEESPRRRRPFVAVNCAALSPTLLESELFGHERGAFTGATRQHQGVFEQADGGTLFLDEVAEIPLDLQSKLLRVLQEQKFTRVGGKRSIRVDVRMISATHRSLRKEVAAGRFREDLMFRLRVVPIYLPPLRDRRGDIPLLLERFVAEHNKKGGRQVQRFSPRAMQALLDHPWKGNVRELQNVVEYAFYVGRSGEVSLAELPPEFREQSGGRPKTPSAPGRYRKKKRSDEEERKLVENALAAAKGNVTEAAEMAGMSRATFWRRRKAYGL